MHVPARGRRWHRLGRKDEVTAKRRSEKEIASFLDETRLLQFSRNVCLFLELLQALRPHVSLGERLGVSPGCPVTGGHSQVQIFHVWRLSLGSSRKAEHD